MGHVSVNIYLIRNSEWQNSQQKPAYKREVISKISTVFGVMVYQNDRVNLGLAILWL